MQNKDEIPGPRDFLDVPPDLLPEACERLAHMLLARDAPLATDPFTRMAEMIFSRALLEVVIHLRAKEAHAHE